VFLVLEATIGFCRSDEGTEAEDPAAEQEASAGRPVKIKWSTQDAKFLEALHISHQEEKREDI